MDFLGQLKSIRIEAQHSIKEWHMFSQHLLHTTRTIYQTTYEGIPQLEQSRDTSNYKRNLQFFNPSVFKLNLPATNHQSRTVEAVMEGSKESHVQVKACLLPQNVRMHEWEVPQEKMIRHNN